MDSEKGSEEVRILTLHNVEDKKEEEIRVLVGIPRASYGQPEAADNQFDIANYLGKLQNMPGNTFKFYCTSIGRCVVQLARETFAKYSVFHNCDFLFMLDDDMIFPVDIFTQLYTRMVKNPEVDICACLAFQRREPYNPVIYIQREGFDPVCKDQYYSNEVVKNYPKDTLFECDAVGFGGVLIKTKVIATLNEPYFMSTNPSGEDVLFCYHARKAGFRVFVDTACKSEHLGPSQIINEIVYEKFNNINRNYVGEAEYKK